MQQTVIIADDAHFMRAMLREILTDLGWHVVAEAAGGEDAVLRFLEHRPDLVMLDVSMPDLDGVEACRRIVGHDPGARVVMVSALGQKDQVLASIRAGAADFVIKPFEPERVAETLRGLSTRQPALG